jgi:hypothetical protein
MFSSPRTFLVPLFVYLSVFLLAAEAHDTLLQQRSHVNLNAKRLVRKRAPLPQDDGGLFGGGGPIVGAAPRPGESTTTSAASTDTTTATSTTATGTDTTTATSASTTDTATSTTATSTSATPTSKETLNVTQQTTAPGVETVIGPNVTRTVESGPATTSAPPQVNGAAKKEIQSTTIIVLIAVAASVGGVFILWTIFRKWKLSSSKEFDRRLNPIDWQPTNGADDDGPMIPGHGRPRPASVVSSRSGHGPTGSGGYGATRSPSSQGHSNPFDDFDSPAKSSAPVGGYADLARGASPNPQMQEKYSAGYSAGPVPLHHQTRY